MFSKVSFLRGEWEKRLAWEKAHPCLLYSPDVGRIDCDGRIILWSDYGKLTSYGWELDHITPKSLWANDHPDNLRARHWHGNRSAGGLLGGLLRES